MPSRIICALFVSIFVIPAHAKLYLVELRTRGTAQGSIYYRTHLELERGFSSVIGDHSSRKGFTVTWLEEHVALVDVNENEIETYDWGDAELLSKPLAVTDVKFNFRLKFAGSGGELKVPLAKIRILPGAGHENPRFNVEDWPDHTSIKSYYQDLIVKNQPGGDPNHIWMQQQGVLTVSVKTHNRARFVTISGYRSFGAFGLNYRAMPEKKCEDSVVTSAEDSASASPAKDP